MNVLHLISTSLLFCRYCGCGWGEILYFSTKELFIWPLHYIVWRRR